MDALLLSIIKRVKVICVITKEVSIEAYNSIEKVERYYTLL